MATSKYEIEKFDGKNGFGLWKLKTVTSLENFGLDETLQDDIIEFTKLILDLENIEVKIEDEDQVVILLNSLPKPFDLLKDAPQYSKDKLSLEGLINAIYSKEIDLRIESKDANIREGLSAQESACYKARLVAKGYTQKEGVNHQEIVSPVVKHTSIRLLLVMVAQYDLEFEQMDVKTALLHSNLEEEILRNNQRGHVYLLPYVDDMLLISKEIGEITNSRQGISWKANLQSIVALPTTEIRYVAAAEAVKRDHG
ncbi:Retrovirus-related Pol polyprotein from transposon TNT 1-94 [Vitis vinifera]|uniref:Retrovirus-related Pol polyprotein from transposon TNT 1-94 n=1 Tax=Vitis vinifera TaxID=29760 RepID=A0A438C2T3_VITVI|nr:Retrovirus-related Pol polyprotein from transposon TNT 1-94 [Vitis vinifera]